MARLLASIGVEHPELFMVSYVASIGPFLRISALG
jgi:hypothetical protein